MQDVDLMDVGFGHEGILTQPDLQRMDQDVDRFQIREQEMAQLEQIRARIAELLAPMDPDENSILLERRDKVYMEERRKALIGMMLKDVKDERL